MLFSLAIGFNLFVFFFRSVLISLDVPYASIFVQPALLSLMAGLICSGWFVEKRQNLIPQADLISSKFLAFAIVLLGSQLSWSDLTLLSPKVILALIICILIVSMTTLYFGRILGIKQSLTVWVLVGNCICGPTAISFASRIFKGENPDLAKSIWMNTFMGIIFMIALPVVGAIFNCNPQEFGLWAGASLQSTAQVVTSASIYSADSADLALILKSIRIVLLVPLIMFLRFLLISSNTVNVTVQSSSNIHRWKTLYPPFLFGFLALAITYNCFDLAIIYFRDIAWLAPFILSTKLFFGQVSSILLSVAMFGIGFLCFFEFTSSDLKLFLLSAGSSLLLVISSFLFLTMS